MARVVLTQAEAPPPQRTRTRRWVIAAAVTLVVPLSGLIAVMAGAFDVDSVHFNGLHRVSYDEAYRAAAIGPGDFLATLNTAGALDRLGELPWVTSAQIRRHWGGTVEINIVERSPAALALVAPRKWAIVDLEGRVLTAALATLPALPRISGIAAAPDAGGYLAPDADALLDVIDAAAAQPGFSIQALWRDARSDIWARVQRQLDGSLFEVALGDERAIGAKTAAIAAVVVNLEAPDSILDVSVAHLPVVRARER